eukprot:scaffold834_cov244-Pinguiococcus_pyrenoidosus.AAC.8
MPLAPQASKLPGRGRVTAARGGRQFIGPLQARLASHHGFETAKQPQKSGAGRGAASLDGVSGTKGGKVRPRVAIMADVRGTSMLRRAEFG